MVATLPTIKLRHTRTGDKEDTKRARNAEEIKTRVGVPFPPPYPITPLPPTAAPALWPGAGRRARNSSISRLRERAGEGGEGGERREEIAHPTGCTQLASSTSRRCLRKECVRQPIGTPAPRVGSSATSMRRGERGGRECKGWTHPQPSPKQQPF